MRICPQCQTVFQEDGVFCPHDRAALLTLRADDARCGQLIDGRYLLLARIGRGGMGSVYRAWQGSTGREVALKLLAEPVAEAPVALERFLREARVTAGLSCPHTVRVYDFGQLADGTPYLAMELVEGVTLDQRLRDTGALPPARAIEIVRQISLALEEAHGQGLVHRDLKPSNVMITRLADGEDFARVLDFGVAKIMDDDATALTAENSNPGTPAYMAPEQARSEPVGPPADVYAVAVMLYEMLTGERPFTGNSAVAVMLQHAQTPPPRLKEKRPDLAGVDALDVVLQRGLAKHPAERYPDAGALRGDLERLRTGEAPTAALALAATVEASRPKTRRLGVNLKALGCSVQLAVAVGALALVILPTWRDAPEPGVTVAEEGPAARLAAEQPAEEPAVAPAVEPAVEPLDDEAPASTLILEERADTPRPAPAPVVVAPAPAPKIGGSVDDLIGGSADEAPAAAADRPGVRAEVPPPPPPAPPPRDSRRAVDPGFLPQGLEPPKKKRWAQAEVPSEGGGGGGVDLRARALALRPTLAACGPAPAGASLRLEVEADGRVGRATLLGPAHPAAACVVEKVQAWRLPAPGQATTVDLPLE